jgi:hypothetical protein
VSAAPPVAPSTIPVLAEEDELPLANVRLRRRRKKRKRNWQAKLLSLLPPISLDGRFLGLSIRRWLGFAGTLLVVALLAWLLVPECSTSPFYSVSGFRELPTVVHRGTSETQQGIIVHIHRTRAGTIDERIVTRTIILDLSTKTFLSRGPPEISRSNTALQAGCAVEYEIEWTASQGIVSVTCDGQPVPRGLWSRLWDVDR